MKYMLLIIALVFPPIAHAILPAEEISPANAGYIQEQAPKLTAKSWLLYDYTSSQVLLEQNSHQRIEPASLTKLMTTYIVFSALKQNKLTLDKKVYPSELALHIQRNEAHMYLEHKQSVSIEELLRGLIVISASDAARVLAETIAGSDAAFAELMNMEAQRLGMVDSHFANSTGFPNQLHYSSAYDLTLLTAAILHDFPQQLPLYSQRDFTYNHIKHYNSNRLLWMDPYVDGIKSGHTDSAGYCLLATAIRGKHRLISAVLGSASDSLRNSESQRLLNFGYQNFDILYLYEKNESIHNIRLWKGTEKTVKAGLRDGLTLTLPKGQRSLLKASIETHQPLLAPISDGQQIGVIKLTLDNKPFLEYPLVALDPVPLVNIFSRGLDSIHMLLDGQ
ncbi:MAG: D-alanyl-D-alanine carboxypeptidase family protein [Gallionellaceae bacterium]|jgi:D-alanyl-D-alanine carboxypeptidase (penicillin-binding protein 5/6)